MFYLIRKSDGQYLQTQMDVRTGESRFWFEAVPAWSPAFQTRNGAIDYRHAVRKVNFDLGCSLDVVEVAS